MNATHKEQCTVFLVFAIFAISYNGISYKHALRAVILVLVDNF